MKELRALRRGDPKRHADSSADEKRPDHHDRSKRRNLQDQRRDGLAEVERQTEVPSQQHRPRRTQILHDQAADRAPSAAGAVARPSALDLLADHRFGGVAGDTPSAKKIGLTAIHRATSVEARGRQENRRPDRASPGSGCQTTPDRITVLERK